MMWRQWVVFVVQPVAEPELAAAGECRSDVQVDRVASDTRSRESLPLASKSSGPLLRRA